MSAWQIALIIVDLVMLGKSDHRTSKAQYDNNINVLDINFHTMIIFSYCLSFPFFWETNIGVLKLLNIVSESRQLGSLLNHMVIMNYKDLKCIRWISIFGAVESRNTTRV